MEKKVAHIVKITLALQNVRSNLAQSLNVSVSDSRTWSQAHVCFINYFNNATPHNTKGVYQFTSNDKKEEIEYVKKGKGRGQNQKGHKKYHKGPHIIQKETGINRGIKRVTKEKMEKERTSARFVWHIRSQCSAVLVSHSGNQYRSSRQAYNSSEPPQDQLLQTLQPDQLRGLSRSSFSFSTRTTSFSASVSSIQLGNYGSVSYVLFTLAR